MIDTGADGGAPGAGEPSRNAVGIRGSLAAVSPAIVVAAGYYVVGSGSAERLIQAFVFGIMCEVFFLLALLFGITLAGKLLRRDVSFSIWRHPLNVVVLGALLATSFVYLVQQMSTRSQMDRVIACVQQRSEHNPTGERVTAAEQVRRCASDDASMGDQSGDE
ncbi:MAG TPA: hypothetical protein VFJ16_10800 [Longimicrobium sp.]|nr:hypothetical protein [Longimicrobium sp.]